MSVSVETEAVFSFEIRGNVLNATPEVNEAMRNSLMFHNTGQITIYDYNARPNRLNFIEIDSLDSNSVQAETTIYSVDSAGNVKITVDSVMRFADKLSEDEVKAILLNSYLHSMGVKVGGVDTIFDFVVSSVKFGSIFVKHYTKHTVATPYTLGYKVFETASGYKTSLTTFLHVEAFLVGASEQLKQGIIDWDVEEFEIYNYHADGALAFNTVTLQLADDSEECVECSPNFDLSHSKDSRKFGFPLYHSHVFDGKLNKEEAEKAVSEKLKGFKLKEIGIYMPADDEGNYELFELGAIDVTLDTDITDWALVNC